MSTVFDLTTPLELHLPDQVRFSDDEFAEFCALNSDLRIERNADGTIVLMAPTFSRSSRQNAYLVYKVSQWAEQDDSGVVFDSNGGFALPNGAIRAPDVSWVSRERLAQLTPSQKEGFLPLCPDFVLELRSSTDRLQTLQDKMQEYLAHGARLGWLIDPVETQVMIYRPDTEPEQLTHPNMLSGDPVLSGFMLDLLPVWTPDL